jgi:hypothetical protein
MNTSTLKSVRQAFAQMVGVVSIGLCAIQVGFAQVNLLQNSGFEQNGTGTFNGTGVGPGGVPYWTSGPGSTVVIENTYPSYDDNFNPVGNNYAVLDSSGKLRGINQTVNVVKGDRYTLVFDYGVLGRTSAATNTISVSVNGVGNNNLLYNTVATADPFRGGDIWTSNTFKFVAANTGVVDVQFKGIGTAVASSAGTAYIDNVSLTAAPVPEASTVVLFGLLLVGGMMMLRKRTQASGNIA